MSCFVVCATQYPLDILDRENDEDSSLLVHPVVFDGQTHAVEQDAVEHFGVGRKFLKALLLKKRFWDTVEGKRFTGFVMKEIKEHKRDDPKNELAR